MLQRLYELFSVFTTVMAISIISPGAQQARSAMGQDALKHDTCFPVHMNDNSKHVYTKHRRFHINAREFSAEDVGKLLQKQK